jgi:uncharacterized protein YqhQ
MKKSKTTEVKLDFAVGGQAVIEGVMMRSPRHVIVSVRDEHGKIHMKKRRFISFTERYKILKIPVIRGVSNFVESLAIGFKALDYSNSIFIGEDPEAEKNHGPIMKGLVALFGLIYGLGTLAFTLFLLKFLPLWIATKLSELWPYVQEHWMLFNTIDGLVKILIFLSYILLISLLKDIRRVFQYHGAEHKSIWAYEKGLELTVANARKQTRFHPRCGTSFIVIVILMSILVYTLIPPAETFALQFLQRIVFLPLIAGISYEFLKASARYQEHLIMRILTKPGLFIQNLTTREPDDEQLEVALHSLKASLEAEHL